MRKIRNNTSNNKRHALLLAGMGVLSVFIDGTATGLLVCLGMAIPLFLAKKNVIV